MKFIFATPIYPPEIGGPAIYSKNLKEGLEKKGHSIKIISYQGLKNYPQPFKIILYFLRVFKNTKSADFLYAFNLISCGLPACLCSRLFQKKLLVRIGGDFLWERAVEGDRTKKPLREYYQDPKTKKEKFWLRLVGEILKRADKIIFTSNFQREIYLANFGIKKEKTTVIANPFPCLDFKEGLVQKQAFKYQLLYAGRLIKLKNLDFLIRVFKRVCQKSNQKLTLKIIGQGPEKKNLRADKVIFSPPLSHKDLLREIQESYLCVLPSITEITPNFALECIKLGKPILLTKETGYFETLKDYLIFIDPRDETDLEKKILDLLDEENYLNYAERIKKIPTFPSWDDVIEEHEKSFIH